MLNITFSTKKMRSGFLIPSLIILSQIGFVGCSHRARNADQDSMSSTSRAAAATDAQSFVTIEFEPGQATLTESGKEALRALAAQAPEDKVNDVKVLAWADKEYPSEGQKAAKQDVDLAEDRADAIKNFIKDDLNYSVNVDEHNMARRPTKLSELLKTRDFAVKRDLEQSGDIPVSQQDESILNGSKASSALVLVTYE